MVNCTGYCSVQAYADDTQLFFFAFKNTETTQYNHKLNTDLESICNYSRENSLSIYASKTCDLVHAASNYREIVKHAYSLIMWNGAIEFLDSFKNLGIHYHELLRFRKHVGYLTMSTFC